MKRNFLFIKSTTESTVVPVDSFSHAEYTSDTTVTVYFDAKRSGKDATIAVVLTVSSGKSNDVVTRLTNQITSEKVDIMRYDASSVPGKFHTADVTGITSITTTEGPAQLVPSGGDIGEVLTKDSATDYDVSWQDVHTLYVEVRNQSGGTLAKGTPVHATGSTGEVADVIAARADTASAMPATYVLNEEIADGANGQAIISGTITGVDTSLFAPGDVIYVGATGGFVNVKPTGTNLIQNLGVVTRSNSNTGSGVVLGSGRSNDIPNIPNGQAWIGNASGVATPTTLAAVATSGAYSDLSGTPTIPSALSDLTGTSDNITEGTTNKFLTTAEETKLGFISVTQAVDLDTMESDIATNNAKVSNVTTDLTTTHAASTVTVNSSDGTDATINGATTSLAGVMTGADKTKLDGIETSADVTDATNVTSSLVAATAISAGDKTTIQTNIGVDPAGTDNSTDVSINASANDVLRMNPGQILGAQDAAADKLVFWDDTANKLTYAAIGTNLTMSSGTLSASGGGGSANMSQSFSAPTSIGEFQSGARLVTGAYGGSPAASAGTLVYFGNTNVAAAGAQLTAAAATGMLTVVTDANDADELLVEGVVRMATNSGWSTAIKGAPLYMSTTAGRVTTTAPSTTGDFVRVVGHVVDATNSTIYFKPDNTWLEL